MMVTHYLTERLTEYILEILRRAGCEKVIWLGYSPGLTCIYQSLLDEGIADVRVFDNDKDKWGWIVRPRKKEGNNRIKTESFNGDGLDSDTIFLTASNHYKEFVKQLAEYDVREDQIIDINSKISQWMDDIENENVIGLERLVGSNLRLEQLKILKWFKTYATDNNLTWWLGEGSMLGAIRHEGFIPWDDDIDIFMPYEDYIECIKNFPCGENYELLDWRVQDRYPFQFAKIIEKNTYQLHGIPFGYFTLGCAIDIFPIAGYPSNNDLIIEKYKNNKMLDAKWDSNMILMDLLGDEVVDVRQSITDTKYGIPFYESEFVGTMQQIAGNVWAIPRKAFSETINKRFEDDYYPVPKGYDEFLTARYGDYMILPPENKRRVHSYPTYKMKKG